LIAKMGPLLQLYIYNIYIYYFLGFESKTCWFFRKVAYLNMFNIFECSGHSYVLHTSNLRMESG
jgi:hypothetical protein